ncbi:MAG: FG-GAP-like repeat-containing protein [Verrucomicrobiota bacterium]|nr:FG-GAP-like repeat-containing protein [Verrucomicrobiota bacterium]
MKTGRGKLFRLLLPAVLLGAIVVVCAEENIKGELWSAVKLQFNKSRTSGFKSVESSITNIDFSNLLDNERSIRNRNLLSGSGVAAGDIDNDGLCDLYFCGLENGNKLYRNLGGWKFSDVTDISKVSCLGQDSTAAAFADIDGDGDLDLLVNSLGGGTRLFRNDNNLKFTETTNESGLKSNAGSMSMTLADIENDGDLDVYVTNFHPTTIKDRPNTRIRVRMVNGQPRVVSVNGVSTTSPNLKGRFEISKNRNVLEYGEADFLFINDGNGLFEKADYADYFLNESGQKFDVIPLDWGLAARFSDINQDGYQDLYVCNDLFTPDRIWINDKKGRFKALPKLALRNTSTFSMGVDFADFDRDGDFDFFVVDMLSRSHAMKHLQVSELISSNEDQSILLSRPQFSRNTLQVNRGDNTFEEVARYANVEASEWSWGPIFIDVDFDGHEDILVTNGQLRDFQNADMAAVIDREKNEKGLSQSKVLNLISKFPDLRTPNVAFRNNKDGTFSDYSSQWGFDQAGISQGMALADLDNDGDMDVVMNNLLDSAGIYENLSPKPRIRVQLNGIENINGIGARIVVTQNGLVQKQEIICAGRYLSSDQSVRTFGVQNKVSDISITWPSGAVQSVSSIKPDYSYTFKEPSLVERHEYAENERQPLFDDISNLLKHKHQDRPYEDFQRQLLIPIKYSQSGPGISWVDIDSDGFDDLIISNGAGGRLSVYHTKKGGKIEPARSKMFLKTNWDQTMILPIFSDKGLPSLIVGVSDYESDSDQLPSAALYDFTKQKTSAIRTAINGSTGPMCQADLNGDGVLEVFIGGQIIPSHYPAPADSALIKFENGSSKVVYKWETLGMVQSAVFSDVYGDEKPELITAQHWGSLRVFTWSDNDWNPIEITNQLGLSKFTGWWNGVATGDFNNDGLVDIVATNWGLNWRSKPTSRKPKRIYYGDLYGDGTTAAIEASLIENEWRPDRRLNILRAALPPIRENILTFESLGKSNVRNAFGSSVEKTAYLDVVEFRSGIFINKLNAPMEFIPLPAKAQLTASFGVAVEDFDGDAFQDVFLAQNFFATNPEYSRSDSGRGLLLKGNGNGGFRAVSSIDSGIKIYGEQRACATSDFNQDGRIDLVVGQNSEITKLFLNSNGKPGVRIRLKGNMRNPYSIGAKISSTNPKFIKEIQSGSGYWASNSTTVVFPKIDRDNIVEVTWPDSKKVKYVISAKSKSVELHMDGDVVNLK